MTRTFGLACALSALAMAAVACGPPPPEPAPPKELPETEFRRVEETAPHTTKADLLAILASPEPRTFDGWKTKDACGLVKGRGLCCLLEMEFGGALFESRRPSEEPIFSPIPQPDGVVPHDSADHFDYQALTAVEGSSDIFARWAIEGNGDHALALQRGGRWRVDRFTEEALADSFVVRSQDGTYYLLAWLGSVFRSYLSVYRVDERLSPECVGGFEPFSDHGIEILDAEFTSPSNLHIVWCDVSIGWKNRLHVRTIDFDVSTGEWSNPRWIFVLNKFVGASHPVMVKLEDGTIHYLWTVGFSARDREYMGVYYQSHEGQTFHIPCDPEGLEAVSLGNRIVFAYTESEVVGEVSLGVIQDDAIGPLTTVTTWSSPYGTDRDHLFLGRTEDNQIWLVDTHDLGKVYSLKIVEGT